MARSAKSTSLYPAITIPQILHPNRWYAIPILGGLTKFIMLLPVFVLLFFLGIAFFFTQFINAFVVLFTGTYWQAAYEISVLIIFLNTKVSYFFLGLTNSYPGFYAKSADFSMSIPFPKMPKRFFAFPFLGGLARCILLIPYFIFASIIQYAGHLAAIIASFPVLFVGHYPESLYELARDSVRVNIATTMYFAGLSDEYPSFWISLHHKGVKILLIIVALIFLFGRMLSISHPRQHLYHNPIPLRPTPSHTTY